MLLEVNGTNIEGRGIEHVLELLRNYDEPSVFLVSKLICLLVRKYLINTVFLTAFSVRKNCAKSYPFYKDVNVLSSLDEILDSVAYRLSSVAVRHQSLSG